MQTKLQPIILDPKRVYKDQVSLIDDSVLTPPPSCAPKSSNKVSQYAADFEILPELAALGFIRVNITAMSTRYTDSAINKCMDNLKEPSSLATLTILIKQLQFEPANISNMLSQKSGDITKLTSELENIKSLMTSKETMLKARDISSAIVKGCKKRGQDTAEIPSVIKALMAQNGLTYVEPLN